ncbi:MAG: Rrf2 family transcriptional regulator [Acidobacteriota bacterium]|nr:Rrf2 family transcriptional regulator [Acidobacteriota bacterium]
MQHSVKMSRAIHVLAYVAENPNGDLSSDAIATSIRTNPGTVRQLMSSLRKAMLLETNKGQPLPCLAEEPENITLAMIYEAVEGDKPILHVQHKINEECSLGKSMHVALRTYFFEIQERMLDYLNTISLADVIARSNEIRGDLTDNRRVADATSK